MPRLRALICDLDGTLLDTLSSLAATMDHTLQSLGLVRPVASTYPELIGDGAQRLAQRATPVWWRDDAVTVQTVYHTYLRVYERRWPLPVPVYDGITELLDAAVARGVKLAVLSNKADTFTTRLVPHLLGKWPWAVIRGQRDHVPRKPAPDGALAVAHELGIEPAACLFLGDSDVDMQCARTAGMYAVGAGWGFRSREELEANGAQVIAAHPSEVAVLLD